MEEQNTSQNPQAHIEPEAQVPNQTSPHHKHSKKKLIFVVLGVIILLIIFSGAFYYMGMSKNNNETTSTTAQIETSPVPTEEATKSAVIGKNLVPITENTVSYGYQGDKLLMNYRGKVYSDSDSSNGTDEPEPAAKYKNITWYGLVDAPQSVNDALKAQPTTYDEVFNFTPLMNNDFSFVMRWDRLIGDNKFASDQKIYYFDVKTQTLKELASFTQNDKNYSFPIFNSASPDGKNLAFNMFGCWNCGGHYPEIRLINVDTKATKNLGRVIEFKWTGSNTYSYKEYKEIECSEPQPGPCLKDEKNLPLKTGTFN